MDAQEYNSILLNMPELVLHKILCNIHNPSIVARSCKYLYEVVCGMERCRRVMHIGASDAKSPLNIDDDTVFDSIMNSHRTIKEMDLRLSSDEFLYRLNNRQMERITAVMKQFGESITSLSIYRFVLPVNFILDLLQQAPKLESLSFTYGKVKGSVPENTAMLLQLHSLKALEINEFHKLLDVVNLIPPGSLNSIRYTDLSTESTEILATILTKQHNIKSLTLDFLSNSDVNAICVDHLQLESLTFDSYALDTISRSVKILKCQTNLKELRIINYDYELSGSSFQWICNNLKKLEVFEVRWMDPIERNAFEMLDELKQLRHFRTYNGDYLFHKGFQSFQLRSELIEKLEFGYRPSCNCGKLLNKIVYSLAHNLPNLTHLAMAFENFSALCFVLHHCSQIIHLISNISNPIPDQLTGQRFPNVQSLELKTFYGEIMRPCITPIVRAMPNLKSMSIHSPLTFDVNTMKEFINESRSLEYFYVDPFVLHRELSSDDVIETIRRLTDPLKGYRINFIPSTSPDDLNFDLKDILSNDFYVRDYFYNWNEEYFYLCKGGKKIIPIEF